MDLKHHLNSTSRVHGSVEWHSRKALDGLKNSNIGRLIIRPPHINIIFGFSGTFLAPQKNPHFSDDFFAWNQVGDGRMHLSFGSERTFTFVWPGSLKAWGLEGTGSSDASEHLLQ